MRGCLRRPLQPPWMAAAVARGSPRGRFHYAAEPRAAEAEEPRAAEAEEPRAAEAAEPRAEEAAEPRAAEAEEPTAAKAAEPRADARVKCDSTPLNRKN
jgi:hypothetical protein